eukprot:COSAG02_NODE_9596_length_2167_cov_1.291586_2_plen_175_part_00
MRCIDWEDSAAVKPPVPGTRHARYVLEIHAGDQQPYQIRKRWQEISDFAKNLSNYNQILRKPNRWGDNGEQGLPPKYFKADLQREPQMKRMKEINDFLAHLTRWLMRVADEAEEKVNLLLEHTYDNGRDAELNIVATFLNSESSYDAMRSTLTPDGFAALSGRSGVAARGDSRR